MGGARPCTSACSSQHKTISTSHAPSVASVICADERTTYTRHSITVMAPFPFRRRNLEARANGSVTSLRVSSVRTNNQYTRPNPEHHRHMLDRRAVTTCCAHLLSERTEYFGQVCQREGALRKSPFPSRRPTARRHTPKSMDHSLRARRPMA